MTSQVTPQDVDARATNRCLLTATRSKATHRPAAPSVGLKDATVLSRTQKHRS